MNKFYQYLYNKHPRVLFVINKQKYDELDRVRIRGNVFKFLNGIVKWAEKVEASKKEREQNETTENRV